LHPANANAAMTLKAVRCDKEFMAGSGKSE
jgi:hypothetical protein